MCVSWDFNLEGGDGDWSESGCRYDGVNDRGRVLCECDHLTNFAVLVVSFRKCPMRIKLLLDFNFSIYHHSIIQRYDLYSWGSKKRQRGKSFANLYWCGTM